MDAMQGLTEKDPRFIADTYFPSLAQFGVIGAILFLMFWMRLTKKSIAYFQKENIKDFAISIVIICFFLIECTSDATITHNRGLFIMMLLALTLTNQQQVFKKNNEKNSYIK